MVKIKKIKKSISSKNWPFSCNEVVKLIWMDHPYRNKSGDWKIDIYFKSLKAGVKKKITESWGIIDILSIGRLYMNRKLISERELNEMKLGKYFNEKVERFNFNNQEFMYKMDRYSIKTEGGINNEIYNNAFVTKFNGFEIHIPVIEVLKSIIIQNRKLVYDAFEPNSLDKYCIIEKDYEDNKKIIMNFTKEYPGNLLSENNIYHLLWLKTNTNASKAWNSIYMSLNKEKSYIKFPFPLEGNFYIIGRCKKEKNIIRIEEIIKTSGAYIQYNKVIINSPNYYKIKKSNAAKRTAFRYIKNGDIILDPDKDKKINEEVTELPMATHEYNRNLEIIKIPFNTHTRRKTEDSDTEKINISGNNVTTSPQLEKVKKIEFKDKENIDKESIVFSEDIESYIEIINKLMENYKNIKASYSIDNLPDLKNGKNFSKLDDKVRLRKYLLSQIIINNKKTIYLIEVERYGKSLSTLIINPSIHESENMQVITNEILEGLVEKNGVWDSNIIEKYNNRGFTFNRIKHISINKDIFELAERLYDKIVTII